MVVVESKNGVGSNHLNHRLCLRIGDVPCRNFLMPCFPRRLFQCLVHLFSSLAACLNSQFFGVLGRSPNLSKNVVSFLRPGRSKLLRSSFLFLRLVSNFPPPTIITKTKFPNKIWACHGAIYCHFA